METVRRVALEAIIRESEKSLVLASSAGEDFLAYLLEQALHEARARLVAGDEPPALNPLSAGRSGSSVVSLRPPRAPRKP